MCWRSLALINEAASSSRGCTKLRVEKCRARGQVEGLRPGESSSTTVQLIAEKERDSKGRD